MKIQENDEEVTFMKQKSRFRKFGNDFFYLYNNI